MAKSRARSKLQQSKQSSEQTAQFAPMETRRPGSVGRHCQPKPWQGFLFLGVLACAWLGFLPSLHARHGLPTEEAASSSQEQIRRKPPHIVNRAVPTTPASPNLYTVEVLKSFHHDPQAFTQGLVYYKDDIFYESTGLYGHSSVREVQLTTGKVLKKQPNAASVFGEGLALWKDRLLQISWQTRTGYIYNRTSLKQVGTFKHPMTDGWGLTDNGTYLFGSDGTSYIYVICPKTYSLIAKHKVTDGVKVLRNLNELEYVKGELWANIWLTDCIVKISPDTGRVTGWIHAPELRARAQKASNGLPLDVLNGIAWDSQNRRLYVTGKLWPAVFQIKIHKVPAPTHQQLQSVRDICT